MPSASARQQTFDAPPHRPIANRRERGLGLGKDRFVALGIRQLDQLEGVGKLAFERDIVGKGLLQPGALAHEPLSGLGIVPKLGILDTRIQRCEPRLRVVPVKDTSSAARATAGFR